MLVLFWLNILCRHKKKHHKHLHSNKTKVFLARPVPSSTINENEEIQKETDALIGSLWEGLSTTEDKEKKTRHHYNKKHESKKETKENSKETKEEGSAEKITPNPNIKSISNKEHENKNEEMLETVKEKELFGNKIEEPEKDEQDQTKSTSKNKKKIHSDLLSNSNIKHDFHHAMRKTPSPIYEIPEELKTVFTKYTPDEYKSNFEKYVHQRAKCNADFLSNTLYNKVNGLDKKKNQQSSSSSSSSSSSNKQEKLKKLLTEKLKDKKNSDFCKAANKLKSFQVAELPPSYKRTPLESGNYANKLEN